MKLSVPLHTTQREVYFNKARHKLVIASRRWGKTRLALSNAITQTFKFPQELYDPWSPPVTAIVMDTLKQATALYWQPLLSTFEDLPITKKIDKQEKRICFHGNFPDLILRGADNGGDSLRGLKMWHVVLDEVQQIDKSTWDEVISPALADTPGSTSLKIGTPCGLVNWVYPLSLEYVDGDETAFFTYTVYDNEHFPKEEIERQRAKLPDRVFRQEFLAEFVAFEGKVFTEYKNPGSLIHPASIPNCVNYYIGIDPGAVNAAASLIGLDKNRNFYIINKFKNTSGEPITVDELVAEVKRLIGYIPNKEVKRVFIPDDRPELVRSFRAAGIDKAVLISRRKVNPLARAEILNNLFRQERLKVNSELKEFHQELESYHRAKNSLGEVVDKIADNQIDHLIDSAGYCIGELVINDSRLGTPDGLVDLIKSKTYDYQAA